MRSLEKLFLFTPTLDHYRELLQVKGFPRMLFNSIVATGSTTLIAIPFGFSAAYALSRLRVKGSREISLFILATRMIPSIAIVVPVYSVFRTLELINTITGLVIAYVSFALPFAIWVMRGFLAGLPDEYEDSAMIDGCSRFGAMVRIILPLSTPGVISASLFVFLNSWGEMVFALNLTIDNAARTAPIGLAGLISAYGIEWGELLAGSTILIAPMVLFTVLAQRHLVGGLSGGIKQ
jgi:multiple sugar transport system permease protein